MGRSRSVWARSTCGYPPVASRAAHCMKLPAAPNLPTMRARRSSSPASSRASMVLSCGACAGATCSRLRFISRDCTPTGSSMSKRGATRMCCSPWRNACGTKGWAGWSARSPNTARRRRNGCNWPLKDQASPRSFFAALPSRNMPPKGRLPSPAGASPPAPVRISAFRAWVVRAGVSNSNVCAAEVLTSG